MSEEQPTGQIAIGSYIAQALGQGARATINIFRGGTAEQRALHNRQAMLKLVHDYWVKGVLEQSLHGVAMIEFRLERKAGAVKNPWNMVLQTEREDRVLPPGTRIIDVFDEMRENLLILGAPGSGKTTMLLELARSTIARAEEDPLQPIPVVLNLSSWAEKRQPLAEWLVEELNTKYNIPKRIARPWIENDDLLLLLDGLDEVKAELRDDCVGALNGFRKEHGLAPLVVCSRVEDYEALTNQLELRGAVLLQPLTPQQIDRYLDTVGGELAAVREALQQDNALREMVQTPLMLSVMALAYRDVSIDDLQTHDSVEIHCRHLFATYTERMFTRRGDSRRYSKDRTIAWLTWLAHKMTQHAQTVFMIERMQPSWLETSTQRRTYSILSRVLTGLTVGAFATAGMRPWVVHTVIIGLVMGVVWEVLFRLDSRTTRLAESRRRETLVLARRAAVFGICVGLVGAVYAGLWRVLKTLRFTPPNLEDLLLYGVMESLLLGLASGAFFGRVLGTKHLDDDIATVETFKWSWRAAIKIVASGILSMCFSLAFGIIAGTALVTYSSIYGDLATYVGGSVDPFTVGIRTFLDGLSGGVRLALFFGAVFGVSTMRRLIGYELTTKTFPNQGIWLSLRNAVPTGLAVGLFNRLAHRFYSDLELGLRAYRSFIDAPKSIELKVGIASGLIGFVLSGGLACIQHFVLRVTTYYNNYLPWHLVSFLDYATERIFLRKVGGGYIFVHRLLMEYFASLYQGE